MTSSPFIWCCVANIAKGLPGTKHFSPGTKCYLFPQQWGDGLESVQVIGKHRGGAAMANVIMRSKHLVNARPSKVYVPKVLEMFHWSLCEWDDTDESMEKAAAMASHLNRKQEN